MMTVDETVQCAAIRERAADELLVGLFHEFFLDSVSAVDADADRHRISVGKLVTAHRFKPVGAPESEFARALLDARLDRRRKNFLKGAHVAILKFLDDLNELLHQRRIFYGRMTDDLAEPAAPNAVKNRRRKGRVYHDAVGNARNAHGVLYALMIHSRYFSERGVNHRRRSSRNTDKFNAAANLGGDISRDVENRSAAERYDDVVGPDFRIDHRRNKRHHALEIIGLILLAAAENDGSRSHLDAVLLKIPADARP